jgi:hypothetical protein
VTEIDLALLPTGDRGWAAFVEWAAASDDRQERFFLEVKSDVDLNAKHGQHKVAKFVLGAANRDPAHAARRLAGSAVMLLGVGGGRATGIGAFEAKDLEREVQKFTGVPGPGWDYVLVPVDADHDVVAVIVDPPTGRIWPSLTDGQGLTNGDVYLRGDGATHKASGAELNAMLTRSTASPGVPQVEVAVEGSVRAIRVDENALRAWINDVADDNLDDADQPSPSSPFTAMSVGRFERRSKMEFRNEIARWRTAALANPTTGLHELVARTSAGIRIHVTNPTKSPLRELRIDFYLDKGTAVEREEPAGHKTVELFSDRPAPWGQATMLDLVVGATRFTPIRSDDRRVRIVRSTPAHFSLDIDLLRAREEFESDDDQVVLVTFGDNEIAATVTVTWTLTSGAAHGVLEGALDLPVAHRDWIEPLAVKMGDARGPGDEDAP